MKNHHHNGPVHSASPNSRAAIHETIAALAYERWERSGKPEHQAEAIWLAAEQELMSGHRMPSSEPVLAVSL